MPKHSNEADAAQAALDSYAGKNHCDVDREAFRDLITDLGHWADRNGVAFENEIVHALATWWREKAEED